MTASNGFTRYQKFLLATFVVLWIVLAIKPYYRQDWLLENILVAILVPTGLLIVRYFRLSNLSYTLITVFLILHIIGAHYTYEEVPLGDTISAWFGAERNHYDRVVHFSFGFLLAYPIREMFLRIASVRGLWGYFLPFDVTLACSAIFEIFEWLVAAVVNPQAGLAYLGSQGDIWDAQKDMYEEQLGSGMSIDLSLRGRCGRCLKILESAVRAAGRDVNFESSNNVPPLVLQEHASC